MTSKKFSLDANDVKSVGKNAFLVGLAAATVYVVQNLGDLDLGSMSVVVVPIVTFLADSVMKWAKGNRTDNAE